MYQKGLVMGGEVPKRASAGFLGIVMLLAGIPVDAMELLAGQIEVDNGELVEFSLSAEDRHKIKGGEIRMGDRVFRVTNESRLGLIGAVRPADSDRSATEYAVFSSSFSEQTAAGQPWVKADRYRNCDRSYNSFLAIYRVEGREALAGLGPTPYPVLVDDPEKSDHSEVYCFLSRPPSP